MPPFTFDPALRKTVRDRMAVFDPARIRKAGLRKAAVAVVIARQAQTGEATVIVTLRSSHLRRHGAQYALPGGRLDDGETELDAALRETSEELGLKLGRADMIGRLDDFPTRSGFRITPFVAWAPEAAALVPDRSEVAEVFHIPFSELDSDGIPCLEPSEENGPEVMSGFFPTLGHRMFAPTAAILYQFREIALRGRVTRVAHFEQPAFAWK